MLVSSLGPRGLVDLGSNIEFWFSNSGYLDLTKCMVKSAQESPICKDDLIDINIGFVKNIFENAVNLICREWVDSNDSCDKFRLEHADVSKYENVTGTFFTPLINVLANI